jgi:hypothetical protein
MKKKVLVDINISCDMPRIPFYVKQGGVDAIAEYCESWAAEFNDFIRDHRSQDAVSLCIEREYEDVCSFCGNAWEADESGTPCCCDNAREEFTDNQERLA